MDADTQLIIGRLDQSDRALAEYQERVMGRLDRLDDRTDGLDDRLDELEHQQAVADGRASVFAKIRNDGLRIFIVVLGAFAAGYFSSLMGPERIELMLPNKDKIAPTHLVPKETPTR